MWIPQLKIYETYGKIVKNLVIFLEHSADSKDMFRWKWLWKENKGVN